MLLVDYRYCIQGINRQFVEAPNTASISDYWVNQHVKQWK